MKVTKWIPFEEYGNYTDAEEMGDAFWDDVYTFRTWGSLMAEIWGYGSDKMGYCEFAWSSENEGFENVDFEVS